MSWAAALGDIAGGDMPRPAAGVDGRRRGALAAVSEAPREVWALLSETGLRNRLKRKMD